MDYDQTAMPAVYDAGRGYLPQTRELWRKTIVQSVSGHRIREILDLGCGTGRYTGFLAQWFDAKVIGVEPSSSMLAIAREKTAPNVSLHLGAAENIPLTNGSVDMVFMSMVFHHFNSKNLSIQECRRVLRTNGRICMRAGTIEQVSNYPYSPFFPETNDVFKRQLQSKSFIEAIFYDEGFELIQHDVIRSTVAKNWHEFAQKVSLRADSTLSQISDNEFRSGLDRLRTYAQSASDEAVDEPVDYFVFQHKN